MIGLARYCIFIFIPLSIAAQDDICWDETTPLKWSDFKGEINSTTTYIGTASTAASSVRIISKSFWRENMPDYNFKNVFSRSLSWVSDTTESLLSHEQLHFDISEIYARRARKSVDSLRKLGIKDLSIYKKKVNHVLRKVNSYQLLYDQETAHGVIEFRQDIWANKILEELKSLQEYASKHNCKE